MLRSSIQRVPALPQMGGKIQRVLGSTDARGEGTEFAIPDVGPFLLVAVATGIEGPSQPPFGRHPHAGLIAISHVSKGQWRSYANVVGQEDIPMTEGDVLVTLAGRGITHDEITVGDGEHGLTQIILRLPVEHQNAPPALSLHTPVEVAEGVWRLFDRELLKGTGVDALAYQLRIPPGGHVEITVEAAHTTGFVYAQSGAVTISGERMAEGSVAVLGDQGTALALEADAQESAECLVGLGAPVDEAWAKLLGHNGFVVAADEDSAAACLRDYERAPQAFGQGIPRPGSA